MINSFETQIAKEVGVNAAILFYNLSYWIEKNATNNTNLYDGNYWTYNSVKAFSEQFEYFTSNQIRTALKKLIDSELIIEGNYNKHKYDRKKWYAIHFKAFEKYNISILNKIKFHLGKNANGIEQNHKPIANSKPNSNIQILNSNTYNNSEKKISDFPKAETSEKKESKTIKKTVVLEEKKGKAILSSIKAQNLQSSIILPKEKEKPKMTLFCAFQHAFWDVLHPDWTHGGAVDGKKMKNIIKKIKKRVDNKNPNATEEHYVQAWEMVLGNLPPFYQSANLSKIESALDGIIDEIITKTQKKNPKSSQAIHTIAKQAGIDADWRENVLKSQKRIN